jgi:uncharacterized protein YgiM (DUF1202 family)
MQSGKLGASLFHSFKNIGLIISLFLLVGFLSACQSNDSVAKAVQETLEAREAAEAEVAQSVNATVEARLQGGAGGKEEKEQLQPAESLQPPVTVIEGSTDPSFIQDSIAEQVAAEVAKEIASITGEQNEVILILDERVADVESRVDDIEIKMAEGGGGGGGDAGATSASLYISVNSDVNVRSGPGTFYGVVSTLSPGEKADVLGKSNNGWYNVKLLNGSGWLSSDFTSFVDDSVRDADIAFAATVPPAPTATRAFPTTTPTPTTVASTATPTATPTSTPTDSTTVIVVNDSASMVCQLLIDPSTAPSDDNRLGLDPLVVGGQISIELTEGATIYDFEARSCADDSVIAAQDGVEIFENYIWTIKDASPAEE